MITLPDKKALVMNLRNPQRIQALLPRSKIINVQGKQLIACPHKLDEVKVLRNLGIKAPSPILTYYDWPHGYGITEPMAAQKETAAFLTLHNRAYVLSEIGTGKTLSVLWAYDYLRSIKQHKSCVVVAPKSALVRTWEDTISDHFPHLRSVVLHGERSKREQLLRCPADIYITNFDGVKILSKSLAAREDITLVIIDELPETAANARTGRWSHMNWVVNGKPIKAESKAPRGITRACWGMTGTPIANSPTEAWAQARLVTPETVSPYFNTFKELVMRRVSTFKWVPREEAITEVYKALQPSIRFARDEIMDLPPTTWADRDVDLTTEQAKAYRDMQSQLFAEVRQGTIVAANEGVKVAKLIQIAIGVSYGHNGSNVEMSAQPRLDEARHVVTESEGKVLIFVPYIAALHSVADYMRKCGFETRVVHGSVSMRERNEIFGEFQQQDSIRVLVCQPDAMAHSLTLTRASTIVWFAPTLSAKTYEQACGRITRPGQTRNTYIVHLVGTDIERRIYTRLKTKQRLQGVLLDMAKENR